MKIVKIAIPIYFGWFRIIITDDFVKSAKSLKIPDEGVDLNSIGAFVNQSTINGERYHDVFFQPDAEHDLIAHEVVHLVNSVYVGCHMKLDPKNDEPQAYLAGWFTNEIYKALTK